MTTKGNLACTFIGGGVLATCIIDGLLDDRNRKSQTYDYNIRITTRRTSNAKALRRRYPSLLVTDDNKSAALWDGPWSNGSRGRPSAHVVLICTQPEFTAGVCAELSAAHRSWPMDPLPIFVTMCPGITVEQLESWLPSGSSIVRTMPNTPVSVGQGATAIFANGRVSGVETHLVSNLFYALSPCVEVLDDEVLMDVAASVSGSGPAYIYKVMAALIQAGIERGLPRQTAEALVRQSALGAAFLAVDEPRQVQDLVNDVCVPGGSTEKAMAVLEEGQFSDMVSLAVEESLQANRAMAYCHRNAR